MYEWPATSGPPFNVPVRAGVTGHAPGPVVPAPINHRVTAAVPQDGITPAAVMLLAEIDRAKREGTPQKSLLMEVTGNQSVHCNEKLFVPHLEKNRPLTWLFTVTCSMRMGPWCHLKRVFTLDPYLPEFSIIEVKAGHRVLQCGAQGCECESVAAQVPSITVLVRFLSKNFGSFNQRLVFDFGVWPKVVRCLGVVVAPEQDLVHHLKLPALHEQESELVWLSKHQLIPVDLLSGSQVHSDYSLPSNMAHSVEYGAFDHLEDVLTPDTYRIRLHMLLHIEEFERRRRMSRLTLQCDNIRSCLRASVEEPNQQTLSLPIQKDLIEEASVLVGRGSKALVRIQTPDSENKVLYEVVIESLKVDSVLLRVSSGLCEFLSRTSGVLPADVCFRFVDTYKYMHNAIERVDLEIVYPNQKHQPCSTLQELRHDLLNHSQTVALHRILDLSADGPPLLLLGPFGTGKTRTIVEAVKELCLKQAHNPSLNVRILLCTHSNSAADHYINAYLHSFFLREMPSNTDCRPLRVCWEHRFASTLSETVLQYCLISQRNGKFLRPTVEDVDKHRVVVTTLVTADMLTELKLPQGYFTHIFIDEAAQAMEVESIIPLCLADRNTTMVMAGDHLQLNPPILSKTSARLGLGRSLLVRLSEQYPKDSCNKLLLLENYRAYEEIVEIPSTIFYGSSLIANLHRPSALGYSVHFYGVLGREEQAMDQPSFFNRAEAAEVAERVENLYNTWPTEFWGEALPSKICVLAPYPAQVREIRRLLRQRHLNAVRVEGVTNVQGLEFDALFISTVRTYNTMNFQTLDQHNLGFLSNPQLLNTAVTRARYYLAVVGDPNALCSVGENKVCWRHLLNKCNEHDTYHYRLPFNTLLKMIGSSHSDAAISAPTSRGSNPAQPVFAHSSLNESRFIHQPRVGQVSGHSIGFYGNRGFVSPLQHVNPAVIRPLHEASVMNFRATLPHLTPVSGYGFNGSMLVSQHPRAFLFNTSAPQGVPFRPLNVYHPNVIQSYAAAAQYLSSRPVPGHPSSITSEEQGRSRTNQPGLRVSTFTSYSALKQQADEQESMTKVSSRSLSSSAVSAVSQSEASLDDSINVVHEVRTYQAKVIPQLRDATREEILKQVKVADRNLRLRKMTSEKDRKSFESLLDQSLVGTALLEQLKMQLTLVQEELQTLENQACIQDKVNDMLGLDPTTESLLCDTITDLFEDSFQSKSEAGFDALQTDEGTEDGIDLDMYEWFETRRKDPIVQEYIKAFERIMSQRITDVCTVKDPDEVRDSLKQKNLASSAENSECTTDKSEETVSQKWVVQSRKNIVHYRPIYEEHMDEQQVKEKVATGELLACTLHIHSSSHGSTATAKVADPTKPDVIIQTRTEINRAFNGDIVAVQVTGFIQDDPKTPKGKIVAICKEVHHREVVCSCDLIERNIMLPIRKCNPRFVVMRSNDKIAIHGMESGRFYCKSTVTETKGKLFVLRFMQWGSTYRYPLGVVVRYFSAVQDPRSCLPMLAAEYGIHQRHSKESQSQIKRNFPVNWKIPEEERRSRVLYTKVFTLDPEGSSELDDALSVELEEDGSYTVGVHITDASYFIPKGSALDKAAYAHGQSVYPRTDCGHHVPMLPPNLTIKFCSLLPGKTRLALSTIFSFDAEGNQLQEPRFHKSLVRSCCKLTYEQCHDILQGGTPKEISKNLQQSVLVLGSLARKMAARRIRGGCVPEGEWTENQQVIKIVEEFMLLTNSEVALQVLKCPQVKGVVPLRRQLPPKSHLLNKLLERYTSQGLWPPHHLSLRCLCRSWKADEKPCIEQVDVDVSTWEDISATLDRRDLEKLTDVLARRSGRAADVLSSLGFLQEKSSYVLSSDLEPSLQGHFSLNAEAYTHFTSPLRRFLDLVVHRIKIAVLNGEPIPYSQEELAEICVHCNAVSARVDAFEKHLSAVSVASLMKRESKWKLVKLDSVSVEQLMFTGQELEGLTKAHRSVHLRDLRPSSREWNEREEELVLTWNVIELNLGEGPASVGVPATLESNYNQAMSKQFLKIPSTTWVSFLDSVCAEDFKEMDKWRQRVNERAVVALEDCCLSTNHCLSTVTSGTKGEHPYVQVHTQFYRRRDQAPILMTGQTQHGFLQPTILAIRVSASVLCCVLHHRRPVEVFCEPLQHPLQRTYSDVQQYQSVMVPLLMAESATTSVNSEFPHKIVLNSVSVMWNCNTADKVWQGHFTVPQALFVTHGLHFSLGDFLCVRVSRVADSTNQEDKECWIMHCRITDVTGIDSPEVPLTVTFKLTGQDCDPTESLLQAGQSSIELITQCLPYRRMLSAVNRLGEAPELARGILLRRDIPAYTARNLCVPDPSTIQLVDRLILDEGQLEAVRRAVTSPLTLIQGPPGTGKTWTAVAIIRQFLYQNSRSRKPAQVLYCAPSNQAVDVATKMLQKVEGLRILRVYGRLIESQRVKPASQVRFFPRNGPVGKVDPACEDAALHSRIRRSGNPHSARITSLEEEIAQLRKDECASSTHVSSDRLLQRIKEYRDILDKAEQLEMAQAQVILCTCTEAGSSRIRRHTNIAHVIIDECSTCLEAQVLVVLSSVGRRSQNTVFLGDHKQLAPVVQNKAAIKLGLARSLFEVMFEGRANKSYATYMLKTQYRMHPSIRQFPSEHFYQNQLKDAAEVTFQNRLKEGLVEGLWPAGNDVRLVFCHVVGEEESPQDCTGADGREESKYNDEEVRKTVEVVRFLQSKGVRADQISVFTPYTAQRTRLTRALHDPTGPIEVLSVSSSQGSEQDFVVISTVRSLPSDRVVSDATLSWQMRHLGFLTDQHQINVAITRAKHGLIIIGNRELLAVHEMWKSLLKHYQSLGCVVDKGSWP